jgi:hypothetical protein
MKELELAADLVPIMQLLETDFGASEPESELKSM